MMSSQSLAHGNAGGKSKFPGFQVARDALVAHAQLENERIGDDALFRQALGNAVQAAAALDEDRRVLGQGSGPVKAVTEFLYPDKGEPAQEQNQNYGRGNQPPKHGCLLMFRENQARVGAAKPEGI